ncbi:MAG: ABC transporter permease [Acidobacteria bacterium]|nr:ABC transporter permease [Acidobacteriota bacterium]
MKSFLRHPSAAALAAVAAMALGIGAAVAIFSVVDVVLLKPLPYPGADRMVAVWNHFAKLDFPEVGLSEPELPEYGTRAPSIAAIAAVANSAGTLTGGAEPERVFVSAVSPSLFPMLGVQPARGRVFGQGEDRLEAPHVAVISDAFWRRRQADPKVLGSDLLLDGEHYTVIGVMPPDFRYPEKADLWVPLRLDPKSPNADRGNHYLRAFAQLKPGVDLRTAQAEMSAVASQMQQENPGLYQADSGWGVTIIPFHEELTGDVRPSLLIVLAAVGLVLLMACANVANLQLERALARSREIAVRTALGEPRGRLIRRFITESLAVTCIGGGLGVLVAAVAVRGLTRIDPTAIPRAYAIALDARVLLFAIALAVLSGLVIGLVPAVQTSKLSLVEALKEGGEKSVGGRGSRRVRRLLVVSETAMALMLIVGAGLLVHAFANLVRVDTGYDAGHTLTLQVSLPAKKYPDTPQIKAFWQRLLERVAPLPGVRQAAVIDCLPLGRCDLSGSYFNEATMAATAAIPPEADLRLVTSDYFRALRIPLKQGSFFPPLDSSDAPRVVIVDEDLARKAWPGKNAIGQKLKLTRNQQFPWRTVIGVVGHVKNQSLGGTSREQLYLPVGTFPENFGYVVVRAEGDPQSLAGPIRDAVKKLDADLPIFDVQTMSSRLTASLAARQFSMTLLLGLAILAIFLAAVGMYSVITNSVNQRHREIGMRMALGAKRRDILGMVVGEGVVMALLGIAAGLALAYWATRLLASLLFGISATDVVTYLETSLLLIALAAVVSYFPARKATRVSPNTVLGRE